jgi:alkylglycerol monooxygenase
MDLFAISIPLYLLLILLEAGYGSWKNIKIYRFNDTISNLNTGILSLIYGLGPKAGLFFLYIISFEKLRIFDLPNSWWAFVICLVAVDFCAYWFHRFSHEINLLWGSHMVHHRSEEFNFSVALRQSANGLIPSIIFFLPAAFAGVSPEMYTLMGTINLVYQFILHTQTVGKLPAPIEYIFNTPSHHRVHHAVNPKYIDKNYSGIFIVFDRMFGTFQAEEEAVKYGITKPLQSWNPLWSNVEHFIAIWDAMKLTPHWGEKMRILFDKPGWMPRRLGGPQQVNETPIRDKFDTKISRQANWYVLLQFTICFSLFSIFYYNFSRFEMEDIYFVFGGLMIAYFMGSSGMLENKEWAWPLEVVKVIATPFVVGLLFEHHPYFIEITAAFSVAALLAFAWLFSLKEEYEFHFSEWLEKMLQR